jgi:hypothetical protein
MALSIGAGWAIGGGWTMGDISLVPPTVEYLVISGGGSGGGGPGGGGGGAGGLLTNSSFAVNSSTTYAVTVGAGGSSVAYSVTGNPGNNSVLLNNNGYSYSFNGSSQYLTANNAALALGTGDFTVEAWVYTTVSSGTQCVYDTRLSDGTATGFYFGLYASNTLLFYTGGVLAINAGTVPINTWTHIALVRVGNTFTVYVNGTSVGTATNSNNFTNTNAQIGSSSGVSGSTGNYYNGYLSNLRVVKGVSVYTGNFTIPTSPLAATQSAGTNISAITGTQTSLLTLQNATIVDNSTYALSITNTGSVAFSSNTPFDSVTATGGGAGAHGGIGTNVGGNGGSGGGGGSGPNSGTLGSPGGTGVSGPPLQGYSGGYGTQVSGNHQQGGGGGGGSGIGGNSSTAASGPAGDGGTAVYSSISGASVSYAGGGGGGGHYTGTTRGGYGGGTNPATGGGGNGANQDTPGTAGSANTGGGGGGGGNSGAGEAGQAGGSGVVILKYPDSYPAATSTTGSPTITVAGGYRVYIWTSSGSITF